MDVNTARAVTVSPPALTDAVKAGCWSAHNHTGTFTATRSPGEPTRSTGAGTVNCEATDCANCTGSGGGGGAGVSPFNVHTGCVTYRTPSGKPGRFDWTAHFAVDSVPLVGSYPAAAASASVEGI